MYLLMQPPTDDRISKQRTVDGGERAFNISFDHLLTFS
jgi:hypothetical protein